MWCFAPSSRRRARRMPPVRPASGTAWQPTDDVTVHQGCQPFFELHGSSNWETETGERVLIIGGAFQRFPILRRYHDQFAARLRQRNVRLMVIGYSFSGQHINSVIEGALRERDSALISSTQTAAICSWEAAEIFPNLTRVSRRNFDWGSNTRFTPD